MKQPTNEAPASGGLFAELDHPPINPFAGLTCRSCEFSQPWEFGSKVIYYCDVRGSSRTHNGRLKIKLKNPACQHFQGV